jgi:hypothetical protein
MEDHQSEIYLEAWPKGHDQLVARLLLDARLVEALLAVRDGYTTLGSLGPYRRDLSRFFGKLGQHAQSAFGSPDVSVLVNGKRTRVRAIGSKSGAQLSFEAQG